MREQRDSTPYEGRYAGHAPTRPGTHSLSGVYWSLRAAHATKEPKFSWRRVKRRLYRASGKRYLNAEVNGAYYIIRKGKPDAFAAKGVVGLVVHPVRMVRTKSTSKLAS